MGNSPYFVMPAVSPTYIEKNTLVIGEAFDRQVDNITTESQKWWTPDFVADRAGSEIKKAIHKEVNRILSQFDVDDYIEDVWGVCVANGDNQEHGPDNLFVFVDPAQGKMLCIDFAHPYDISNDIGVAIEALSTSLLKFDIDPTALIVPTTNLVFLNGFQGISNAKLKEPRGICTDRKGSFWLADKGNDRVLHFRYNPSNLSMDLVGELTGLDKPQDVAVVQPSRKRSTAVLCIANVGDNTLACVDANIVGTADFKNIGDKEKGLWAGAGGTSMVLFRRPMSVSASSIDRDRISVAYDYNKIAVLRRDGEYSFEYINDIPWPGDGLITCLKNDADGNLFVLDNTNCMIGKYGSNNELVFTTGRFYKGLLENYGLIGFNSPKYLAIGRDHDNFFVTEKWEGYNGIKKFSYAPRFLEHSAKFSLDCEDNPYDDRRHVTLQWDLTKDGYIAFELAERRDGNWNPVISSNGTIPSSQGPSVLRHIPFIDEAGNPLSGEGVYRCTFWAYREPDNTKSLSNTAAYTADLSAPGILHDYVGIAQEFFNPEPNVNTFPRVSFQVTRDALVNLTLISEDGTGGTHRFGPVDMMCYRQSTSDGNPDQVYEVAPEPAIVSSLAPLSSYLVKATMMGFPQCGAGATDIQLYRAENVPVRVYLDNVKPKPVHLQFCIQNGALADNRLVTAFNPNNPGYDAVNILSAHPLSDNSSVANGDLTYSLRIYPQGQSDRTIRTICDKLHTNGQSMRIQTSWDGRDERGGILDEGVYVIESAVQDVAGNRQESNASIAIDQTPPTLTISLSEGTEPNYYTHDGNQHLALTQDVTLDFSVVDNTALPHALMLEITDLSGTVGLTYNLLDSPLQYEGENVGWTGSITVPIADLGKFPHDGAYSLRAYATDRAGNRSSKVGISDPGLPNIMIEKLWINKTGPSFSVLAAPSAIRSGRRSMLCIDASATSRVDMAEFSYTYEASLIHEKTGTTVASHQGVLNEQSGLIELEYSHQEMHGTGKFVFAVQVNDRCGQTTSQTSYLLVDSFDPSIDRDDFVGVPTKFYVRGQVGDPDLSNDKNIHGFESYCVLIRPGVVTSLPNDIEGWSGEGVVYVPFDKVSRTGVGLTTYPFSHIGDGLSARTETWGQSVLAYIDASSLDEGPHTVIVLSKEMNKPLEISAKTAAMRVVSINKSLEVPGLIGDIALNGHKNGDITVDFNEDRDNRLTIEGQIRSCTESGMPKRTVDVFAHIYRDNTEADPQYEHESIVAKLSARSVADGDRFSIMWNGRGKGGEYVLNGKYRIIVVMEETVSQGSLYAYDHIALDSRIVNVVTPLYMTHCTIAPQSITKWPATDPVPKSNLTTLSYRVCKPCDVYFDVLSDSPHDASDRNTVALCTVGPKKSEGGAAFQHTITWDGIDPMTGRHVAGDADNASVRIRPFVVPLHTVDLSSAERHYFDPDPASAVDYFVLEFANESTEHSTLGTYTMPRVVYGNSDALWETQLNADFWAFPAVTTSSDFWVTGTQSVMKQLPAEFQGFYFKKELKEVEFIVKVKWGIYRRKQAQEWYYHTGWGKNGWRTTGSYITESCGPVTSATMDVTGMPCTEQGLQMCFPDEERQPPDYVYMVSEFPFRLANNHTEVNWNTGQIHEDSYSWENLGWCQRCFEYITKSGHCITDLRITWGEEGSRRGTRTSWFNTFIEGDPLVEWVRVYTKNGTLVDCIYETGDYPVDPVDLQGIFHRDGDIVASVDGDHAGASGAVRIDWAKLRSSEWVPMFSYETSSSISLLPGESEHFIDVSSNADPEWEPTLKELVPVDGQALFSVKGILPAGASEYPTNYRLSVASSSFLLTNEESSTQSFERTWDVSICADCDKDLRYEGSVFLSPTAPVPTEKVDGVCMPFPPATGQCYIGDQDVKDNDTFRWVTKNGREDAVHPNDGFHFRVSLKDSLTIGAQEHYTVNLPSKVIPAPDAAHDVTYERFLFPPDDNCNLTEGCDDKLTHGGRLAWNLEASELTVDYVMDSNTASMEPWNSPGAQWRDPILSANKNLIRGYYRANEYESPHNEDNLHLTESTFGSGFSELGAEASIAQAYRQLAQSAGIVIPIVETSTHWTDVPESSRQFGLWSNGSGALRHHDGEGLSFKATPWTSYAGSGVGFRYVDGTPNPCFEMNAAVSSDQLVFRPRIAANAVPKRLVPIEFNFTVDKGYPFTVHQGDVMVYDPDPQVEKWFAANVPAPVTISEKGKATLGYWDATYKAGTYFVRITPRDAGGKRCQVTTTVAVGTRVQPGVSIDVKSPLRRATLRFSNECNFDGMVAINPVTPEQFGNTHIPDGFLVDISPSNIMFRQGQEPQLVFYLTHRDIDAIGSPSNLGDIGIYYLDPEHKLSRAEFSAYMYNTESSATRPVDNTFEPNEVLALRGKVGHFSVYGALNEQSFITIDPPVSPTTETAVTLTGTVREGDHNNVYLYVSPYTTWDATAIEYNPGRITVSPASEGRWVWCASDIELPGIDNHIFTTIGRASADNKPTNHVYIRRDVQNPLIGSLVVTPQYANTSTEVAHVSVTLSEPGEVHLGATGILEGLLTQRTAGLDGNPAEFSVPLLDSEHKILCDGIYEMIVTANDLVGNTAESPRSATIIVDRTSPVISTVHPILYRAIGSGSMYELLANALITDERGIDRSTAYVKEDPQRRRCELDHDGATSAHMDCIVDLEGIEEQFQAGDIFTLVIEATDIAGNVSTYERRMVLGSEENLNDWPHSKAFTIDTRDIGLYGDVNDYPVLVRLDRGNFDFSQAAADGHDIRFGRGPDEVDPDGEMPFEHEIEYYDATNKSAAFWVRVPFVAGNSGEQEISMYWGKADAGAPRSSRFVWDKSYRAVYHMGPGFGTGQAGAELPYFEDFSSDEATVLSDLGFSDVSFWQLDRDHDRMRATTSGGWGAMATATTPVFNTDRSQEDVTVELPLRFPTPNTGESWRELNKVFVTLLDLAGEPAYVLEYKPNRTQDLHTSYDLLLKKVEDGEYTPIAEGFSHRLTPDGADARVVMLRWILGRDGGIRVLYDAADGKGMQHYIDADDNSVTRFSALRVQYLTGEGERNYYAEIGSILVTGKSADLPAPNQKISPVLETVEDNGDGTYTAFFGYYNPNDHSVTIPVGGDNRFAYGGENGLDKGQPVEFLAGRIRNAFTVVFDGSNLVWALNGKTATASGLAAGAPEAKPAQAVSPVLERVLDNGDGTYTAVFGYSNPNTTVVTIGVGADNGFHYHGEGGQDKGQPVELLSGRVVDAFPVVFDGTNLVWTLDGRTATASADAATVGVQGQPVSPVLERVLADGTGGYVAYFGYYNPNTTSVSVPVGFENHCHYYGSGDPDKGQPDLFLPGRHQDVFVVAFDGSNLVWTLNGRTATASGSAAEGYVEFDDVSPVLEEVIANPDGSFTAHFGYYNPNAVDVTVPRGADNNFHYQGMGNLDMGQPTLFRPGRHVRVFEVDFDGTNLVWTLYG
ncbi:MAG: DUF2341 domain-containing protein, partial [Chitinivibrionales bacterium]|nr:DUF2341 domain-containing protein [Chitinivibrionales bacterium]